MNHSETVSGRGSGAGSSVKKAQMAEVRRSRRALLAELHYAYRAEAMHDRRARFTPWYSDKPLHTMVLIQASLDAHLCCAPGVCTSYRSPQSKSGDCRHDRLAAGTAGTGHDGNVGSRLTIGWQARRHVTMSPHESCQAWRSGPHRSGSQAEVHPSPDFATVRAEGWLPAQRAHQWAAKVLGGRNREVHRIRSPKVRDRIHIRSFMPIIGYHIPV